MGRVVGGLIVGGRLVGGQVTVAPSQHIFYPFCASWVVVCRNVATWRLPYS
jgi:hypothetical protein